jgi:acyl-CoA dehydrogenase
VRADIAAVKIGLPKVVHDVAARAIQMHGSLGISDELPLARMLLDSFYLGLADGPTDIHRLSLARIILAEHESFRDPFPSRHLPRLRGAALDQYADQLAGIDGT